MGLDMYLQVREFISGGYPHVRELAEGGDERAQRQVAVFDAVIKGCGHEFGDSMPTPSSIEIELPVAYWRKANAIHGWFVKHVQGDKDDCGEYDVSRLHLEELSKTCQRILEHVEMGEPEIEVDIFKQEYESYPNAGLSEEGQRLAAELLPPTAGFFFGGTDLDQWYITDLKDTVEQLTRFLDHPTLSELPITYRSSW